MNSAKVYVRIRPSNDFNEMISVNGTDIGIHMNRDEHHIVNNHINDWSFSFNNIFRNSSQHEMYAQTIDNLVDQALLGFNGVIMCYGQTGSGKTYTMFGATESYDNRGIVPRALNKLFKEISKKCQSNTTIRVSYFEIYNDKIFDLIQKESNSEYQVIDDEIGTYVKGLFYLPVKTEEDALYLLFEGEMNKTRRPHSLNKNSSRSHCIYTIYIESHDPGKENANYCLSKINFVDLAGSERIGKSEVHGESKTEAIYINKSLSFLEQTIVAITNKSRDHVPYRQSTLTHYLQDSLNGTSNVILIANIWEDAWHMQETISTLRFASRMMKMPVKAIKSDLTDPNSKVKTLLEEINFLKNELYMHDSFINRPITSYDELSEQQKLDIADKAEKFLKGDLQEIEVQNIRQVRSYFQAFQRLWSQNKQNAEIKFQKITESMENISLGHGSMNKKDFSRTGLKPSRGDTKTSCEKTEIEQKENIPFPSEAFEEYKGSDGKDLYDILIENKEITKKLKIKYSEKARQLNRLKVEIDDLTSKAEMEANSRRENEGIFYADDGDEIITEEEYNLLKSKKERKETYYRNYEDLRNIKAQIAHTNEFVSKCREKILKEFELWYEDQFNLRPEMMAEFEVPMSLMSFDDEDQTKFNETRRKVNNRRMYKHKCLNQITTNTA